MPRTIAIAALLALAACGSSEDGPAPPAGKEEGQPCAKRSECRSGLCLAGACAAALAAAASCPAAPGTPPVPALGDPVSSVDPNTCVTSARGPAAALPPEMVQDLGVLQVGATPTFLVTTGTSSFVLFSQEEDGSARDEVGATGIPNVVVPTGVRSPGDTLWYDDLADYPSVRIGGFTYPDFTRVLVHGFGAQPVSTGLPVPNTSLALDRVLTAGQVEPGAWTFTVNDWAFQCPFPGCASGDASGRYRVHALTKQEPPVSTGVLDLEVYLATDPTSVVSTAQGAVSHPQVARLVRSLAHFLGRGGLCLGTVTLRDLPQWVKDRYATNGSVDVSDSRPCGDLQQLFTNAIAPSRAVHLFLADALEAPASGDFSIAGVDGSIPGPSGFPGTIYGGAIVGLNDELGHELSSGACEGTGAPDIARCGTDRLAYVAAHEIGHWLGLFHTTEQSGFVFDPVSDTARCACSSCTSLVRRAGCFEATGASPSTPVLSTDCVASSTCGGGRNLMFWLLDGLRSTGELSRDQGQIMRLNPAVR
jgi:hypothetical protein